MYRFALPLLIALAGSAAGQSLRPERINEHFLVAGSPRELRWKIDGEVPKPLGYAIRDFGDRPVTHGEAKTVGDVAIVALDLPAGYYEIEFPGVKQRFGIVVCVFVATAGVGAAPALDPFFAIDGALSWLVMDERLRSGLVSAARVSKISMVRERLTWGGVHPAADRWDWQSTVRFESLRKTYERNGTPILELAHDAPAWMGRVGKYPANLAAAARSWGQIGRRWQTTWGAVEIWNEPDIFFGDNLPGDQYAAVVHAIDYGLYRAGIATPRVGGAVAHFHPEFLEAFADNGGLDSIDVFSFHTYGRAMEMAPLTARYQKWLAGAGHKDMPLWITECGRPWRRGPDRPPAVQDAESALDITMKAVEARASGIERYFAFVYPFYEENDSNFGMMDRQGLPLRSMAAYAQAARLLQYARYVGELKTDPPLPRTRVFDSGKRRIAVLYAGRPGAIKQVRIDVPVEQVRGLDGRELPLGAHGEVPLDDGLAYAVLKTDEKKTPGTADPPVVPARGNRCPIVLRYEFDREQVEPSTAGYRVRATPAGKLQFRVRAFNLSDQPQRITLQLKAEAIKTTSEAKVVVDLPADGNGDAVWDLDFSGAFAATNRAKATVELVPAAGRVQRRLVAVFSGETTLPNILGRFRRTVKLPIGELGRWTPSITGIGTMKLDQTPEVPWRLSAQFKPGDRWVYPQFALPEGTDLRQFSGMVLRGRCSGQAEVRMFLWEGAGGVGYITPGSIFPADGQWHSVPVRFADLTLSGANAADPNGRLDLDQVRRISLGMNCRTEACVLEVGEAYLVGE